MGKTRKYLYFDHQSKGNAYIAALADYQKVPYSVNHDRDIYFVLTDHDVLGRGKKLDRIYANGCRRFFIYPHAARPNLYNDIYPERSYITAHFVVSPVHAQILRKYGYSLPIHDVGWHLCPIREFQPRKQVRNVLFAPIHPRCAEIDKQVNREAWGRLYSLAKDGIIDLTVRYIRTLEDSGLPPMQEGVTYVKGELDQSYSEIDNADVVVGHQTIAWISVARGIPTVMMAEDMPSHQIKSGTPDHVYVKSWDKYKDLLMYPLDLLKTNDTMEMLESAAICDMEIREWRENMIGRPFDQEKFLEILKSYL